MGDHNMSRMAMIATLFLVTALNTTALVINFSLPSKAAVPNYEELINDPNFKRAVTTVIEQCRVNVDIGRVQCRGA